MEHSDRHNTEEEAPSKIFLEVGTRYSPVLRAGKRRCSSNERYVGIDLGLEDLRNAAATAKRAQPEEADYMLFVNADGRRLPMANEVVQEALLSNVLRDPKNFDRAKLIRDIYRVLAVNGTLIVNETYSPQLAPDSTTIALCQDAGFTLQRRTVPVDSEWAEISTQYGIFGVEHPYPESYIVEFKKLPNI